MVYLWVVGVWFVFLVGELIRTAHVEDTDNRHRCTCKDQDWEDMAKRKATSKGTTRPRHSGNGGPGEYATPDGACADAMTACPTTPILPGP